jgi:hypothetical protein
VSDKSIKNGMDCIDTGIHGNRALSKIFGSKRGEVTVEWKKTS